MADVKWIKIDTSIFNDDKMIAIETLPDGYTIEVVWLKLLCLAGVCNESGFLMISRELPYTDEMLAKQFRMEVGTVKHALDIFQRLGMIDTVDNIYLVSNWAKHQNIEGMDRIREQGRLRQQKFREKKKLEEIEQKEDSNVTGNVTDNVKITSNCSYSYSYSFSNNSNIDNLKYILNNNIYIDSNYILDNPILMDALFAWMEYKDGKKPKTSNHYDTPTGIQRLLTRCVNCAKEYGVEVFAALVDDSMANNYQGIIFDKADKIKVPKKPLLEAPKEEKEPEKELSGEEWEKMMSEMSDEEYEKMMSEWPDEKVV